MDPDKTVNKLTESQHKAIEYAELESERLKRLGIRAQEIGCPILAEAWKSAGITLKNATELQAKVLLNPEKFLFSNEKFKDRTLRQGDRSDLD